uniref:Uncharacterized protein n=1 Tax=virus sp. ctkyY8 TaxID=2827995 RepID=A0A8S5REL6_9VIRU|nr:MAG TPA: hypothetical protein [virus sp. ctkyY8]
MQKNLKNLSHKQYYEVESWKKNEKQPYGA